MIEFMYVKFDEKTNFGVKKDNFIISENINATNMSQIIIVENIQNAPTTQDAPTIIDKIHVIILTSY
jgi:hypothetical protein